MEHSFAMEPQGKRTYMGEESKPADYIDLESMLYPSHEDLIRSSLAKLDQDVTDIKYSLQKRKAKVTLVQIEQKLDAIMNLLQTPYGEPRSKKSKDGDGPYGRISTNN